MRTLVRAGALAAVISAIVLIASPGVRTQTPAAGPAFNADVAPILFEKCAMCHRPGEVAPMSLLAYADARPWARAIKQKVLAREMPPWFADPQIGKFRNERRLTQAQIDTLVAWVDAGAPEGTGRPPAAPKFPSGSSGFMDRPPDYEFRMPIELEIPAQGEPPYVKLWTKLPFGRDVLVEAVELRPSNRQVAHHSSVGVLPMPAGARLRTGPAWPGGPSARNAVALMENGDPAVSGVVTGNVLVFYVPGGGYQRFRPGTARRIRRDDYLLWSLHYMPTGRIEKDRHTLAVWLAKGTTTHEVVTAAASEVHIVEGREALVGDERLLTPIPAYANNYERTGIIPFLEPVTVLGLWPHMHNYGKDMTFTAVFPDGREQALLSVPRYDVNWQIQYELAEPLRLPAGSVIRATAHYDNSAANRRNLALGKDVVWGPQSWNEMFGPFLEMVYDNRILPPVQRPDLFAPPCDPFARGGGFPDPGAGAPGGGTFGRPCP